MGDVEWLSAGTVCDLCHQAGMFGDLAESFGARASDGMLRTRAVKLVGIEAENGLIPERFWWARGKAPMKIDWITGDIETTPERSLYGRWAAYSVEFERAGVDLMIPPELRQQRDVDPKRNPSPEAQRRPPSANAWNIWVARYRAKHNPLPDVDRAILSDAKSAFPDNAVTQTMVREAFGGARQGPRG